MFKILVADDEENIRNLFRLRLESEGYEVMACPTFASAKAAIETGQFDLFRTKIPRIRCREKTI